MAAQESDGEEDFVSYGKPLELYEEGEQPKKPVPIQDQTVKDEKGRFKRFHGAFTGGFSAGYFNTVGSKEGWAPSTFVSSRQGRTEQHASRPEDFMDEEDLSEFGIAPKEIMTTDDFASKTKDKICEKARELAAVAAPIPGATILEDLIAPAKITVGVQLLRQMGWKEGQGVGPRIKRKAKKQNSGGKLYGCAPPPTGSEGSEEEEDDYVPDNITFAPKDVMPIDFTVKNNVHGLGYRGLDPRQALFRPQDSHVNLFGDGSDKTFNLLVANRPTKGRKVGMSGQAFGVGALEDEDDDIYGTDSLSKYDTILGEEETGDGLFGWTAPKEYKNKKVSSKELKYIGKMLDGFCIATQAAPTKKVYPPPELPKNYQPVHYFRPVLKPTSQNSATLQAFLEVSQNPPAEPKQELPARHQLTSSRRRELLGETPLQAPNSVLDLLSDKDRERITDVRQTLEEQRLKAQKLAQEALKSRFQTASEDEQQKRRQDELLDRRLVPQSAGEFRPFDNNPEKQKRYENYVRTLHEGQRDSVENCLDPNMTEWERSREREEFMRSAMLYKPTNSSLSSRFTRGKHEDDSDKVEVQRDQEGDMSDKTAAVKMKMFGKLTRDKFEWHPDKVLCKRFNIPDPYPGSTIVGLPKVKRDKYSVFNFLTIPEPQPATTSAARPEKMQLAVENKQRKTSRWDKTTAEERKDPIGEFLSEARSQVKKESEDETEEKKAEPPASAAPSAQDSQSQADEEAEEETRPPIDLFKAIFADSSDEKSSSSEEESDEEETPAPQEQPGTSRLQAIPPSRGKEPEPEPEPEALPPPAAPVMADSPKKADSEEEFGPRLPPPSALSSTASRTPSDFSSASQHESVKKQKHKKHKEKQKLKKEHKHKKEKKKKHKKQKHKNKHKSKKAAEDSTDSEDSSTDASDEAQAANITPRELLRRLKNLPIPR